MTNFIDAAAKTISHSSQGAISLVLDTCRSGCTHYFRIFSSFYSYMTDIDE